MSNRYTLQNPFQFPLKDDDDPADIEKYGRTWISEVKEMAHQVMFNLPEGQLLINDDRITYEEEIVKQFSEKSKKAGQEYRRLKKVRKYTGDDEAPASKPTKEPEPLEDIEETTDLSSIPF